jgi:hypothetical protein
MGAYRSSQAANRAEGAERKRAEARLALAEVMSTGSALLEAIRHQRRVAPNESAVTVFRERIKAWEGSAHAAVEKADAAQLSRYHRPLTRTWDVALVIEDRLARLQEIQDRL